MSYRLFDTDDGVTIFQTVDDEDERYNADKFTVFAAKNKMTIVHTREEDGIIEQREITDPVIQNTIASLIGSVVENSFM